MPKNKPQDTETAGQWQRLFWLDEEIRSGNYPSIDSICDHFEVSRRTAFNTVAYLRDSLQAPLRYSKSKRGYAYEDPTFGLPTVFLNDRELLALVLARQVAGQYLGAPLERALRVAVEKLSRCLPPNVVAELNDITNDTSLTGGAGFDAPLDYIRDLQSAVKERRVVAIQYYSPYQNQITDREIEPHFLANFRGDWMVIAWDRLRDQPRTFMIARMRACRVTACAFQRREQLSQQNYGVYAFQTEYGQEPYEVTLRFDPYIARLISERKWHPSQNLRPLVDGSVELTLVVSGEGDLIRWILQHGRHVEVMTPLSLREKVAQELRAAADGYAQG